MQLISVSAVSADLPAWPHREFGPVQTKNRTFNAGKPDKKAVSQKTFARVTGFEPAASCSQSAAENFLWSFIAVFTRFCSFSLTFQSSLISHFPPNPLLAVVNHVVKNASRPKPVIFTGLKREAFSFHVCWIVTLTEG